MILKRKLRVVAFFFISLNLFHPISFIYYILIFIFDVLATFLIFVFHIGFISLIRVAFKFFECVNLNKKKKESLRSFYHFCLFLGKTIT